MSARRPDLIEEAELLLTSGEPAAEVARRLGYSNQIVLARILYRHGRPDLGRLASVGRTDSDRWHPKREVTA